MSRSRTVWLAVLSIVSTLGCGAHNPAPPAWQVPVLDALSRPRGAWIELTVGGGARATVAGELLAIDKESIHVLTQAGAVTTLRAGVRKAAIGVHANQKSMTTHWTLMGVFSTASHGAYLVLTAPFLWGMGGGLAVASESHSGVEESLVDARKYSRFPQGLPEGLDLAAMPPLAGIGPPASRPDRR